ncbi:ATP-dependent RNA helicase DDX50 [Schistosoma japonicum]|uniref:ATP-dependent RNA helicase DDX50 n=2 Tax=Schistosoma japonicum TaxID=6182 RepID=C1LNZ8_SCHJA|nr:ATP-dependent RNA helicase DDX50 [Schistosoma japonicum]TNN16171.1 ATP-dependent RNA helicase DDX50 [Schistosoma japonicum]CAX76426.1 DEAD (Asp-Glu-Ala-Asp) box polypeptide 50 [Schistosoma japonicum]CAX76427.1 DEAD (Asp-Glu-Ala-Asp) box polypeptide 50 [Schistosoma japonicum]
MVVLHASHGDFSNFNIDDAIIKRLHARNIFELFPVQFKTYDAISSGKDAVVLARTGTGKTLAFSLPLVNQLIKRQESFKPSPVVLVLAPTRELVTQIATDFESICVHGIKVTSVYGGVPYKPQCNALRNGTHVVVGAPGRVIDLIDKGILKLSSVQHVVLDEVDRMLDMGFSKDVEKILADIYNNETSKKPQTLLFSATMPSWVSDISRNYLSNDALHLSLIDEQETKASTNVTHLALLCPYESRAATLSDVIKVYCKSRESRCIVFCERKKDADELAASSVMPTDCHVLHGDVPQDKREFVLQKFRDGKYRTLLTTNVAARGLDVPHVDLVIQCHPPRDVEDYIHRSGRTGRADRSGTSICFYTYKERSMLSKIENMAGITFRRISAPTIHDITAAWGEEISKTFSTIPKSTWSTFMPLAFSVADQLSQNSNSKKIKTNSLDDLKAGSKACDRKPKSKDVLHALCCALACLSGKEGAIENRSALTAQNGKTAYKLELNFIARSKALAFASLRNYLPENVVNSINSLSFIRGKMGYVFDLPSEYDALIKSTWPEDAQVKLSLLSEIPELEEEESFNQGRSGNFGSWQNRSGSGSRQSFKRSYNNGTYSNTFRASKSLKFNDT